MYEGKKGMTLIVIKYALTLLDQLYHSLYFIFQTKPIAKLLFNRLKLNQKQTTSLFDIERYIKDNI